MILKDDVGTLKTDVTGLKDDVGELRSDVVILKDDVGSIKETVHRNYDVTPSSRKATRIQYGNARKLDELHSLIVIFSQQTIKNTTDLRLISKMNENYFQGIGHRCRTCHRGRSFYFRGNTPLTPITDLISNHRIFIHFTKIQT